MMKMYFATMYVNNGTTVPTPFVSNNKRKLVREIVTLVKEYCFIGNTYKWKVWNEECIIVAAGEGVKLRDKFIGRNFKSLIGERV